MLSRYWIALLIHSASKLFAIPTAYEFHNQKQFDLVGLQKSSLLARRSLRLAYVHGATYLVIKLACRNNSKARCAVFFCKVHLKPTITEAVKGRRPLPQ